MNFEHIIRNKHELIAINQEEHSHEVKALIKAIEKKGFEFESYMAIEYPLMTAEIYSFTGPMDTDDLGIKARIKSFLDKDISYIQMLCENNTSLVFVITTSG